MTDCVFAEEIEEFVLQLFHPDSTFRFDDWKDLTPIEFGVLSWHIGNFYLCSSSDEPLSLSICSRAVAMS